jgi:hypothetical protein
MLSLINHVLLEDRVVFLGGVRSESIKFRDLTEENLLTIDRIDCSLNLTKSGGYFGPELASLERYMTAQGWKRIKILRIRELLDAYPLDSVKYLPESSIRKYIEIYTSTTAVFKFAASVIGKGHVRQEYFSFHPNRQIALVNILLYWAGTVHMWHISEMRAVANPAIKPKIILKALQFYSKETTSLKGGLCIPKLSRPQRSYFFNVLIDSACYQGTWVGGGPYRRATHPAQYSFIKDAHIWKRVFRFMNSVSINRGGYHARPARRLEVYYMHMGALSKKLFMSESEYDLAKLTHFLFLGFTVYSKLQGDRGFSMYFGENYGLEILHRLPVFLRDFADLGTPREEAIWHLFSIIGRSNSISTFMQARAFLKHRSRARDGRFIGSKYLPPAPSALRENEILIFQDLLYRGFRLELKALGNAAFALEEGLSRLKFNPSWAYQVVPGTGFTVGEIHELFFLPETLVKLGDPDYASCYELDHPFYSAAELQGLCGFGAGKLLRGGDGSAVEAGVNIS